MLRRLVMLLILAASVAASRARAVAEDLPRASRSVPRDAVVVLELSRAKALLDRVLDPEVASLAASLPGYEKWVSESGPRQFFAIVSHLEARLGVDWRTALRALLDGGLTFAARPDGAVLLVLDARDGKVLSQLHEIFLGFARADAESHGQPDRVASEDIRGVTRWTFGPNEAHAIVGNRLYLANGPDALQGVLDLRAGPEEKALSSLSAYEAARRAAGGGAVALAFVNLEILKQHPPVRDALSQAQNPMVSLLLAGLTEALRASSWLAVGLHVDGNTLALKATVDGKALDRVGPAALALSGQPEPGALPNLSVPRCIGGLTLYRDLHRFYAAKDDLFPERTSGLIFFENMMGIFFSGMDLTEDVFGETRPEIRLVVAEQEYTTASGVPRVQIPAFAAVFRLLHPREFGEVVEEAWQKALGLVNFTRGQQAQPGMIIERAFHGDAKFTLAYFRPPKDAERTRAEMRYNFRPALAMVGDYLVLSSTDGLARDLIDAIKKELAGPARPLPGTHSLLEVSGPRLLSILRSNRENFILQNMIEKGSQREAVEAGFDFGLALVELLGQAKLALESRDGGPRASLDIELRAPGGRRLKVWREGGGKPSPRVASAAEREPDHVR